MSEEQNNITEENPVEKALKGIDLKTITADEVFLDLVQLSKVFAFNLMVAAGVLEAIIKRDKTEEPSEHEQSNN